MKTVVIIQARMTSSRLPGKMMMPLGGKAVFEHVIRRAKMIKGADHVAVALPSAEASRPLVQQARALGVQVVLGSELDVLSRYIAASEETEANVVVRITGDCPLIDPAICDKVIELRKREHAEYASNVWPRSFPKGLDCEVFTSTMLKRASAKATEAYDREHVTPWMVRHSPSRINYAAGKIGMARHNWSLDTPEDYEFLSAIFDRGNPTSMDDTFALLDRIAA